MASMANLTLVIGDQNLSSWSLRPWILLRHLQLPFQQIKLKLHSDAPGAEEEGYAAEFRRRIAQYSPAGRVPVLVDNDVYIWDSLAICEYLNELAQGRAWPQDGKLRAHARAVSAEMHSGFAALRELWSMNTTGLHLDVPLSAAGLANVRRIDELWSDCRRRYGHLGPWLFGSYSVADAMYAPVVLRFNSYGAKLSTAASEYFATVMADAEMKRWIADAQAEVAAA
jgi:glutathione S-transferase